MEETKISKVQYDLVKGNFDALKRVIRANSKLSFKVVKVAYSDYKKGVIANYELEGIIDSLYDIDMARVIEKKIGYRK
jgi:hypothetical protein